MIEEIGGVTPKLVSTALDALLLRHEVTAHNIANASTPGYQAQRVAFEEYVANFSLDATSAMSKEQLAEQVGSLKELIHNKEALVYSTGQKVALDKEMIELTQNVLKYRALIEANGKRGAIMSMAISGGRR